MIPPFVSVERFENDSQLVCEELADLVPPGTPDSWRALLQEMRACEPKDNETLAQAVKEVAIDDDFDVATAYNWSAVTFHRETGSTRLFWSAEDSRRIRVDQLGNRKP